MLNKLLSSEFSKVGQQGWVMAWSGGMGDWVVSKTGHQGWVMGWSVRLGSRDG